MHWGQESLTPSIKTYPEEYSMIKNPEIKAKRENINLTVMPVIVST